MKHHLARLYKAIPFKKQTFKIVKLFWNPPHSVYKHLHFTGTIKIRANDTASFYMHHYGTEIENDYFWKGLTGGWEKVSMKCWIELCRNAKVVFDIGANTGVYALTAKAIKPDSRVYAFEPLHQMFKKLVFNNELNQYDILCIEKAVSDKNGKAIIYETGTDHVAAASLNAETRQYGGLDVETEVETVTLDSFINQNKIDKVDLIKIDVETHEPNVLEGYRHYLSQHRPDFLIEVLTEEVGERLQKLLDGLGYHYFNIDDKNGAIRKTSAISKSDYFNYLICTTASAQRLKLI